MRVRVRARACARGSARGSARVRARASCDAHILPGDRVVYGRLRSVVRDDAQLSPRGGQEARGEGQVRRFSAPDNTGGIAVCACFVCASDSLSTPVYDTLMA